MRGCALIYDSNRKDSAMPAKPSLTARDKAVLMKANTLMSHEPGLKLAEALKRNGVRSPERI